MSQSVQVRFSVNEVLADMLTDLRQKLRGLSDAEIFKLALSRFYSTEISVDENGFNLVEQKKLDQALIEVKQGKTEGPYEVDDFFATLHA